MGPTFPSSIVVPYLSDFLLQICSPVQEQARQRPRFDTGGLSFAVEKEMRLVKFESAMC